VRSIVLHLGSSAPERAQAVLERAEGILEAARAAGREVQVEIVANGGGLDLLRVEATAHARRIAALQRMYPQLALVACGQTVQRLRESGVPVHLLPGTVEASSALDEIVLRMQQGWAYLRI
jgi:intracellular sulfur oxidation DsrE/DsrF family protein